MVQTMPKLLTGVYPGTFDPVTNGHLDIIKRGARIVDRLVIAVAVNAGKEPLLSLEERLRLLQKEIAQMTSAEHIEVVPLDTLLIEFCRNQRASVILRGLRAVSDFDYEFQMAGMNARLDPQIETIFLMASERQQFISSRFVKEIARLGGDIRGFVPASVVESLSQQFGR